MSFMYVPRDQQSPSSAYNNLGHCFVIHPTTTEGTFTRLEEVKGWCEDHFGPAGYYRDSGARWTIIGGTFRVRDDEDAFAFRMRWC